MYKKLKFLSLISLVTQIQTFSLISFPIQFQISISNFISNLFSNFCRKLHFQFRFKFLSLISSLFQFQISIANFVSNSNFKFQILSAAEFLPQGDAASPRVGFLRSYSPCDRSKCPSHSKCVVRRGLARCVCQKVCPTRNRPVCGSNGITYPNKCILKRTACATKRNITLAYPESCGEWWPGIREVITLDL